MFALIYQNQFRMNPLLYLSNFQIFIPNVTELNTLILLTLSGKSGLIYLKNGLKYNYIKITYIVKFWLFIWVF